MLWHIFPWMAQRLVAVHPVVDRVGGLVVVEARRASLVGRDGRHPGSLVGEVGAVVAPDEEAVALGVGAHR